MVSKQYLAQIFTLKIEEDISRSVDSVVLHVYANSISLIGASYSQEYPVSAFSDGKKRSFDASYIC
jgi:hypothetical protein